MQRGGRSRVGSLLKSKILFFIAIVRHVSSLVQIVSYCFRADELADSVVIVGFVRVYHRRLCALDIFFIATADQFCIVSV